MKPIECCPHCSGTTGFAYIMHVTHEMVGSWGERAESDGGGATKVGMAKCLDCGAKVRAYTAEGVKKS